MAKKKSKPKPGLRLGCPTIQKLPSSFQVTIAGADELTTLLQANHTKPCARNTIKSEVFYSAHYSTCPFIIHGLETAALFFRQLGPDILTFLRNIRIIVDQSIIEQSPTNILDVLQLIADCAPRRSIVDISLSATPRPRYMVRNELASGKKAKTYSSYPCFMLEGLVGHNISFLVRDDPNIDNRITKEVLNHALKARKRDSPPPRVNFLHRLHPEVRDMIYGYLVPTGGILFEENGIKTCITCQETSVIRHWQDYCSLTHVCRILSDEISAFVARNNRVVLRLLTVDYYWSDREVAKFHTMLEGFARRVPDWLVERLREVELRRKLSPYNTFVREPLAPLFRFIASRVFPESKQELSVNFVCQWTDFKDRDSMIWVRDGAFVARAFLSNCPEVDITFLFDVRYEHWPHLTTNVRVNRKRYSDAIVKALELNMEGFRSTIDMNRREPVIAGEPFLESTSLFTRFGLGRF